MPLRFSFEVQRGLGEGRVVGAFRGGEMDESFTRPAGQELGDAGTLTPGVAAHAGVPGEALADEGVGVFIGPAFP